MMRKANRGFVLAVTAVVAGGLLIGCGGDDDNGGNGGGANGGGGNGGDGGEQADLGAFCDQSVAVSQQLDFDVTQVEQTKENLATRADQTAELAEVAPEEIKPDVETVHEVQQDLSDAIADVEGQQELVDTALEFEDELQELTAAGKRVNEYITENC